MMTSPCNANARFTRRGGALIALLALCALGAPATGQDAERVTRRMPGGFELTFTGRGLTRITLDERTVAEGDWLLINNGIGNPTEVDVRERQGAVDVRQRYEHATADYTYTFDGEDMTIEAYVTNQHATDRIGMPMFGNLTFQFHGEPDRSQLTKHSVYGQLNDSQPRSDLGHMHPGWANRVGGSYGAGAHYGVGATPLNREFTRTHLRWRGGWKSNERKLHYQIQKPIPPGAARTIRLKLRLSRDRDWKHLLQPYKDHFKRLFGEKQYKSDFRFITQNVVANRVWRSPDNPYGFNKRKRLDRASTVRRFYSDVAKRLEAGNGQGSIIWANTGWMKRWQMFRTDFDVMPPAVEANWSLLNDIYKQYDKRYGVCVRPAELTFRSSWAVDKAVDRDGTHPAQVAKIWDRIDNMMKRGCDIFYFDVFGHKADHIPMARRIRERMGPDIPVYVEHPTDASLAFNGAYMSVRWNEKKGYYIFWNLGRMWTISRWLIDDPAGVAAFYIKGGSPEQSPLEWAWEQGMAPMVHDADFHDHSPEQMRDIQSRYVNPDGSLKDTVARP